MSQLKGKDRLIVALDLPSVDEALELVDRLDGDVTFYKVGWQLFMTGEVRRLLERLRGKNVFVDLKVPADIGNTLGSVVEQCVSMGVRFLTLSDYVPASAIESARAARGDREDPRLLVVPFLSSMDAGDLQRNAGRDDLDSYILERARVAVEAGVDGLIASGDAIGLFRREFGERVVIVSPGIRPAGSATDDHKRHTTPAEAILSGSDYLVVGRPIRTAADPAETARGIIEEIDGALDRRVAAK